MFSIYLSEEIYTSSDKFTVAKDCVGSRKGIRGQENRCDLADFCDHLFERFLKPTGEKGPDGKLKLDADGQPLKAYDEKPDKALVRSMWSSKALDIGQSDLFKATQAIGSIKYKSKTIGVPNSDYVHGIKTDNVLPGVTDYYELMERIGAYQVQAKKEIDKIIAEDDKKPAKERTLKATERRRLEKYALEAKRGATYVHELRLKDTAMWQLKPEGLKSTFGYDIVASERPYEAKTLDKEFGNGFADSLKKDLGNWPEPNKKLTVDKWESKFTDRTAAEAKYDQALADYYNTVSGRDHKRAIDAIDKSRTAISAGC